MNLQINMDNKSNPAHRLLEIVSKARDFYIKDSQYNNPRAKGWAGWANVFEIGDSTDDFTREQQLEIISRIEQSKKLTKEVENILLKVEDVDHKKLSRPFPNLEILFVSPYQLSNFFHVYYKLNDREITDLEYCVDAVAKVHKEKAIDENELKILLVDVQSLYEQVFNLDIDKTLKRILLDMLKIMENAIHEYRIRGIDRLQEAIEQLIGIYVFNKENIEKSDVEQVSKFKNLFVKFINIYSFAADTVQLLGTGEVITKLLGK